ncbi:MAG: T9SS C-terminal target domain-containing protein, partial [Bacteroidetes bacterium]
FAQAKIDAGQNVVMCAGKSTQLNATGGISYQWSPTTGLSDPKIANPIASPTKTTIYTVSVNTGGTCGTVKDSVQISIDALPTLTLPDTTTACITPNPNNPTQQTQVVLQASSTNSPSFTYRWNTGSNQPSITVNRAGTYFVTVSNTSGCFVTAKTVVTFISAITANVQNANITLCAGEKTQLKASGGQIYRWTPITGLSDPNIANPIANPYVTTTYTVTVSGGGACVPATNQVKITVAPKPTLNLGQSLTSCEKTLLIDSKLKNASFLWSDGSKNSTITVNKSGVYKLIAQSLDCNLTLTDSVKVEFISVDLGKDTVLTCNKTYTIDAGLANAKYLWSNGSTQKTLTISKSGKYMVSVTPNNCATVFKDSVTVFIPELDLRKGKDTIRICKSEYFIDAQNPINSTYLWQDGSKNRIFKAIQTAWYKVSVTRTDCNLTFKDSIFVVFPKIDLGKNIETCQTSLTLDPKISGAKYLWTNAKKTTTQKLTITESGSYGVTVTDTCGAVYQSFVTVVFNKIASNFSADTLFSCVNPVNLDAGNKNVSYLWNDNSKNQFLTVTKEGLYSVQMKDSCQKQLTAKVYVSFKKPSLKLNISDTLRTCADSVVLDSKIANATYLWTDGSNKQKLTAKKSGRYAITVRTSCNETLKDSVLVLLIKKPVLDWTFQISDNATVQFTNNSTGENDDQYFWDFGDGNSSTERNPKYIYQKQGNFKASLSVKSKYCGNNTPKLERNINILVAGTENDFSSENLQIFPNPSANGLFTIKHSFKQSISLKINDLLGKTWQKTDLQSSENVLNLANLPKGMYVLEIQAGQQRILHKIVID